MDRSMALLLALTAAVLGSAFLATRVITLAERGGYDTRPAALRTSLGSPARTAPPAVAAPPAVPLPRDGAQTASSRHPF